MQRFGSWILMAAVAAMTTGCFDIEESIDLNKDMSGIANVKIGIDLEPMIMIMAQMQHDMAGKKGPISKAELDAAKADFLKQQREKKASTAADKKEEITELKSSLPPGVKLLASDVVDQDFGAVSTLRFSFDKLSHLVNVKIPSKKGGDPTQKSVFDSPFDGMTVTETPTTFTIRTKPQNPAEEVKNQAKEQGPKPDPETEKMMRDAFKKLRVAYKIKAPFKVVSSNATRTEGSTLIWEYTFETFEKMSKDKKKADLGVMVTYAR